MSEKLSGNGFMWYNDYLSDFNEDSDEGYLLEVDIE